MFVLIIPLLLCITLPMLLLKNLTCEFFLEPSADADIGLVLTLQRTDLQSTISLSLSSSYKPYHLSNHCSPTTFIVTH